LIYWQNMFVSLILQIMVITQSLLQVLPMLEQLVQIMFTLHTNTYNIHFLNKFC